MKIIYETGKAAEETIPLEDGNLSGFDEGMNILIIAPKSQVKSNETFRLLNIRQNRSPVLRRSCRIGDDSVVA